jgi:hypothetical protein
MMRRLLIGALAVSVASNLYAVGKLHKQTESQEKAMQVTAQAVVHSAHSTAQALNKIATAQKELNSHQEYFKVNQETDGGWLADSVQGTIFFDGGVTSAIYKPQVGDIVRAVFSADNDELLKVEFVEEGEE